MITIKQARLNVNAEVFGTDEWEAAMAVVRAITDADNEATDFGPLTSVEGDVWSV